MGWSQCLTTGMCGTSPLIHLRFNAELAALVRVNLQRRILAMTPKSATICGRPLLAARRLPARNNLTLRLSMTEQRPMVGLRNIAECEECRPRGVLADSWRGGRRVDWVSEARGICRPGWAWQWAVGRSRVRREVVVQDEAL